MEEDHGQTFSFGRGVRIRQNREFVKIRNEGKRLSGSSILANWRPLPPGSKSRLGVVTSGKIGPANQRNCVRRRFREIFRKHQHELLHPVDLVLVARNSSVQKDFHMLENDFLTMLRKAGLLGKA